MRRQHKSDLHMHLSVGILIPTFQAAKHLPLCLPPLLKSRLNPRILIIDSSSTDETLSIAKSMGVDTFLISQNEFNHGMTREKGRHLLNTSIVVMMTQDAYLESEVMLEQLVNPLIDGKASLAYARQLPHQNAGIFGRFARNFNYPAQSHLRSIKEISLYGSYTFFFSDSCAAYKNEALNEIGGFSHVLFGEDTIAAAKLLHRGHQIAYVAEARVYHSHDYTLKQEFCRHFDIGFARKSQEDLLAIAGGDSQRGKTYIRELFRELKKNAPWLIPYAFLQTFFKWIGYQLGRKSLKAPSGWNKFFSSQKYYWK